MTVRPCHLASALILFFFVNTAPAQTNIWLGNSASWHNTGNWSLGFIPLAGTDVLIPPGTANNPRPPVERRYARSSRSKLVRP